MGEKLNWINNEIFMDEKLWAPYHIKNDIEYYDDLKSKLKIFYENAKKSGADEESLKIIKRYSEKIKKAVRKYYEGKISTSHQIIKNLIKEVSTNSLAVDTVNKSKAFLGAGKEIQFFRARQSENFKHFTANDMLHIPYSKRGKTKNYRFSIPGIPSLYLGNTTYACWLELGCPSEHDFNVSPVLLDGTQKILNLAVSTRKHWYLDEYNEDRVHCWLKLIVLMIATSYVVEEEDRDFKSEYIVSQSIMLGCKELGLDGVAYYSKRVVSEMFANSAINLALFTKYKKGEDYSSICKCIKVDEAFNFSVYKQLGISDKKLEYEDYRLKQTGKSTIIGDKKRKFDYFNSEFCAFDKFLFATWEDKDDTEFGNALL